jgi:peptidoglycan hydrolase-like protein with peptidoglycan-binding domain
MALSRGDRGDQVRKLQAALKAAGYDPGRIDGIFGPLTQAAVVNYQAANELTANGQADDGLLELLGIEVTGGSEGAGDPTSGSGGDYTDAEDTRFIGLPGHPELWFNKDTGESYIVYNIPGTEPPVPLIFTVSSENDLNSFFGNGDVLYDRRMTEDQITSVGGIEFGSTDSINLADGDPWAGFMSRMERAMEVQPWLKDPEVFALFAGAWLEGRSLEPWELQTTDYWQGLNEAERAWINLTASDPSQAETVLEDAFTSTYNSFKDLGVDPPAELVEFFAMKITAGHWSTDYAADQLLNVTGVRQGGANAFDAELRTFIKSNELEVGQAIMGTSEVEDLFNRWLGPNFMPNPNQLKQWSDKLRRNPEATREELTDMLRQQRLALFPEYTDPNRTYQDIAAPWRNFANQMWGQIPDETDPTFIQLVRLNDAAEGGRLLRKEGIKRGVESMTQSTMMGLYEQIGGNVRNPI